MQHLRLLRLSFSLFFFFAWTVKLETAPTRRIDAKAVRRLLRLYVLAAGRVQHTDDAVLCKLWPYIMVAHGRNCTAWRNNASERSAIVIAAHIADSRNCAILANTLASVACHEPGAAVLIVDNASPPGAVEASVAAAGTAVRSQVSDLTISHERLSRGQLGAWAAADRYVHKLNASGGPPAHQVVLLQHSTALAQAVRFRPRCAAVALSTLVDRTSGGGWLDAREKGMVWASAVAEVARIACASPCTRGNVPARLMVSPPGRASSTGSSSARPMEWAAASHAVLALTRSGWDQLTSFRLWPSPSGQRGPAKAMEPLWQDKPCARHCLDSNVCWRGVRGTVPCLDHDEGINVGLINGGMEKFAGIALAHLNGAHDTRPHVHEEYKQAGAGYAGAHARKHAHAHAHGTHAPTSHVAAACYIQDGVWKTHGGNFRPAELARRQRDQPSAGPARVTSNGSVARVVMDSWGCRREDATGTPAEAWYLPM